MYCALACAAKMPPRLDSAGSAPLCRVVGCFYIASAMIAT